MAKIFTMPQRTDDASATRWEYREIAYYATLRGDHETAAHYIAMAKQIERAMAVAR